MICRFWWGQDGNRGKMHWLPWNTLCKLKINGGLGLRELGMFNEALLAKQVWRLMHNTSSLFYKVFKARYFPHCSVLDAQPNMRSSFAWKNILGAKNLIRKGLIRKVGTGSKVRIWEDKWLPTRHHHNIISPHPPNTPLIHVRQLIDDQTNTWRETKIRTTFLPHEAETILGISLSSYNQDDTAIWDGTKNEVYAVRNGYHLLVNESYQEILRSSDTTLVTHIWNTIWSLRVLVKIRHFLWRACHESLPTRKNLHHRHGQADLRCASCTESAESTLHALW